VQGENIVLSSKDTDITYEQQWYQTGFDVLKFCSADDFKDLHLGLTKCIKSMVEDEVGITIKNFRLEDYHKWIDNNEQHYSIVSKTRDLFSEDFSFSIDGLLKRFEKVLGFELTDIDPKLNEKAHIIVRINRPNSTDYNPPHKDIYEGVDGENSYIPKFVNFWIPISGVTKESSLALAKGSHLIPESEITRTREGAIVNNNKYRVRIVKEWQGSNKLERVSVGNGETLVFSNHLIHGLGVNGQHDISRVALEFRLFKK
jgi:hypothetical protein